mmetsp:Transcript_21875/g.60813  ORF Transcript_21875/g.60813 Transcript_21875/m.60813 type:complete len:238 (-) Transcript_21875:1027-1740(-)
MYLPRATDRKGCQGCCQNSKYNSQNKGHQPELPKTKGIAATRGIRVASSTHARAGASDHEQGYFLCHANHFAALATANLCRTSRSICQNPSHPNGNCNQKEQPRTYFSTHNHALDPPLSHHSRRPPVCLAGHAHGCVATFLAQIVCAQIHQRPGLAQDEFLSLALDGRSGVAVGNSPVSQAANHFGVAESNAGGTSRPGKVSSHVRWDTARGILYARRHSGGGGVCPETAREYRSRN